MQTRKMAVALIVAVFTLLQLAVLAIFGYTPYPDSEGYLHLARESLAFGQPYPASQMVYTYPFLWNIGSIDAVEASLALFHSVMPLLVAYALMKGASAWLLHAIARRLCSERTAMVALLLYVAYPANYGESTSLLSELPFMFFVLLAVFLALVKGSNFAAGAVLAVANWFRPMGMVFLLALMVFNLLKWRKSVRLIAGFAIAVGIIGSIAMCRTGIFMYQAKTGWMALMDYSSGQSPESMAVRERTDWNVAQKDSAWQSLFMGWVKEHPGEYASQMPRKVADTFVSDNANMCTFIPGKAQKEYMYEEVSLGTIISHFPRLSAVQWLTVANLLFYYALLALAVLSLSRLRRGTHLLPLAVILIGTLVLMFVGHGEARFHIPFMPFVILMAAAALERRIRWQTSH